MTPKKIKLTDQSKLVITWTDNSVSETSNSELRRYCPCATCMEERDSQGQSYFALYTKDQQTILKIDAVGNYGISITWKDGHSTGIYDYMLLYKLSTKDNELDAAP